MDDDNETSRLDRIVCSHLASPTLSLERRARAWLKDWDGAGMGPLTLPIGPPLYSFFTCGGRRERQILGFDFFCVNSNDDNEFP